MNDLPLLNQPLLWGASLAVIPLILHLLYRRRFRRVEWAPMRYLKLSLQHNRRRIRLEQLLLLLVRMAVVVLLFVAVARPVTHASSAASWLNARSRTSQIIVLDDSLSMGYRQEGRSAFDRAQQLAARLVGAVGSKDRCTLVVTSQPSAPLVREVETTGTQLTDLVRSLRVHDTYNSWPATIKAVDDLVASSTFPIRQVILITDLRRAGWDKDLSDLAGRWASERVRLQIFDVGAPETRNLSLESLEQADRLALVGSTLRWNATVRNGADADLPQSEAELVVDGKPTLLRLPSIPARQSQIVPLTTIFQEPGSHHVALKLADDALEGDNQRWAVTEVQDSLHILLVDGEPSSEAFAGETDFLALALSVGESESQTVRVDVVTDAELTAALGSDPDLIVLAGLASLDAPMVQRLARLVQAGTGLMLFPDEQIDPDNYNQLLAAGPVRLLPYPLQGIVDEEVRGLVIESDSASPLAPLRQLNAAVLERIQTRKYFALELPPAAAPDVHVLARWNNPEGAPAAIERTVGRGRVLLWTTTANKHWSDWPTEPSYVLAMREAAKAIARSKSAARSVTAGEVLRQPVRGDRGIQSPTVELPRGSKPQPLTIDSVPGEPAASPAAKRLTFSDTRDAGLYKMNWQDTLAGPGHALFAVSPDRRESDLAKITPEELRRMWGSLDVEIVPAGAGREASASVWGRELWRSLAAVLLGLVGCEACLATWVGRAR